jgi:hypothetical protein
MTFALLIELLKTKKKLNKLDEIFPRTIQIFLGDRATQRSALAIQTLLDDFQLEEVEHLGTRHIHDIKFGL